MSLTNRLLSGLLAVPFFALTINIAAAETLNLYTTQRSANLPQVQGVQRLADQLKEATNGELEIQIHLAGTLQINAADVTGAVAANIVQLADDFFFAGNVPVAGVLHLPLIIGAKENMGPAFDAALDLAKEAYAEKGVTLLSGYMVPPQIVWLTTDADGIEDIKGKKLRVSSPAQAQLIKALGGVPLVIPPADVTAALERGTVDGMVTAGLGGAYFGGPTKSVLLLPVNYNVDYYIINTSVYEGLSPEHRETLDRLAREAGEWTQEEFIRVDEVALQEFRDRDDFAVIELSEEEMKAATALAQPLWEAWLEENGERGRAIFDAVRAAVAQN